MEPTVAEALAFATVNDVAEWTGITGAVRDSLYGTVGLTGAEHPRVVAYIDPAEWTRVLDTWTLHDGAPSVIQRSQGGLLGLACRIKCGTAGPCLQRPANRRARRTGLTIGPPTRLFSQDRGPTHLCWGKEARGCRPVEPCRRVTVDGSDTGR